MLEEKMRLADAKREKVHLKKTYLVTFGCIYQIG
jgi:hypothetical protein